MVYLIIFLALLVAVIGLSIANHIVSKRRKQKEEIKEEE